MWIMKLAIEHDCTIGNRCKKFLCESYSTPLTQWTEKSYEYVLGQHIIQGNKIDAFVQDLKKDKRTVRLERKQSTIYLLERHKEQKIPARLYDKRLFFIKPVYVNKQGIETWEVASFDKRLLQAFFRSLSAQKGVECTLQKLASAKIKDIYFPKVMPNITAKQKRAYELAVEHGYYHFPRSIDLENLAKIMKVSISTYQEHLRKAEGKIIPSLK